MSVLRMAAVAAPFDRDLEADFARIAALIAAARARGVRELHGTTLSTNVAMLGLAHRLGFSARREIGDAFVTRVSLRL